MLNVTKTAIVSFGPVEAKVVGVLLPGAEL
jgi:hypothetical protein